MTFRSTTYWLVCGITAAIAVGAAEPGTSETVPFTLPEGAASHLLPVPEPGRAFLLFAGIMALAFTYRSAWLSWKRGAKS